MNFKSILLLVAFSIEVSFSETDTNSTLNSRREILEKQVRDAYQNACLRLQELSNWMSVVFKIKGVWASSTVNELSAHSGEIRNETDRQSVHTLPPRPKVSGAECSLKSVQVTAQTYAYLQSQLMLIKMLLGRNIVRTSKMKLEDVNTSLRERRRIIDVFNTTLTDILYKLKQGTQELSDQLSNESWTPWKLIQNIQEGRFLQYVQQPSILLDSDQAKNELNGSEIPNTNTRSKAFFQNLGKALDRLIFPTEEPKKHTSVDTHN